MGGREVGGLANMLANHLDIENTEHRSAVQEFWASPTICESAGLKAVDLFQACAAGKIKALWVMSTNPAVSMPDADKVGAAITNVPFVAVSDIMARTDTGDLADVLLPATGWGEKDGTVTNSERRISRQRAFLPAPEQARPDWQIICDVAARMGWKDAFNYTSPHEIFAEYIGLSSATHDFGRDLDLSIFADADYANLIPTQWPSNDKRFFADGKFFHGDGKARMLALTPPTQAQFARLSLNTGRNRDQWHTMTRTGKAPRLGPHLAEPYAEMHPSDAAGLDVIAGDLVTLQTQQGRAILRTLISERATQGQIFAPMHWTKQQSVNGTINSLVAPDIDPVSGQPALKSGTLDVAKFNAAWYAFAASTARPELHGDYAAISRTSTGWQGEFAGETAPNDWDAFGRMILNQPHGEISCMHDTASQTIRIAIHDGDTLEAVFFAAPHPVRLSRSFITSLIGTQTSSLDALAGRGGADQVDAGTIVCACMNVGINTINAAIADGASTVDAVGASTFAGTNCGSCKPEISTLLSQFKMPMAAE